MALTRNFKIRFVVVAHESFHTIGIGIAIAFAFIAGVIAGTLFDTTRTQLSFGSTKANSEGSKEDSQLHNGRNVNNSRSISQDQTTIFMTDIKIRPL